MFEYAGIRREADILSFGVQMFNTKVNNNQNQNPAGHAHYWCLRNTLIRVTIRYTMYNPQNNTGVTGLIRKHKCTRWPAEKPQKAPENKELVHNLELATP